MKNKLQNVVKNLIRLLHQIHNSFYYISVNLSKFHIPITIVISLMLKQLKNCTSTLNIYNNTNIIRQKILSLAAVYKTNLSNNHYQDYFLLFVFSNPFKNRLSCSHYKRALEFSFIPFYRFQPIQLCFITHPLPQTRNHPY